MNAKFCEKCGTIFLGEIIGQFVDFDADFDRHGTVGTPLCSDCLGTGMVISEFKKLSKLVDDLRYQNFTAQITASDILKKTKAEIEATDSTREKEELNKKCTLNFIREMGKVEKNNDQMIAISRQALKILAKKNIFPIEESFAMLLKKELSS